MKKLMKGKGLNFFWSIKTLLKFNINKKKGFKLQLFLHTIFLRFILRYHIYNLIRNQLVDLIENTFRREEVLYLACNEERAFFASEEYKKYDLWSCQKVTDILIYLLDNIFIRIGSKLYRQNVEISMGTNCAPLLLICFCSAMRGTSSQKKNSMT